MRWVLLVVLAPAIAVAGGDGNEAEKLYRSLEKRVARAKTLRVAFASKAMKGDKEAGHLKGLVDLTEGNKGRIEGEGSSGGKDLTVKIVSDGTRMKVFADPPGTEQEQPLPKNFTQVVRTALSRVGLTAGFFLISRLAAGKEDELDRDQQLQLSEFKLAGNARLGRREARVIEYKVSFQGNNKVSMKLWLDARTNLPLKRELIAEKNRIRISETYSEFKLGE